MRALKSVVRAVGSTLTSFSSRPEGVVVGSVNLGIESMVGGNGAIDGALAIEGIEGMEGSSFKLGGSGDAKGADEGVAISDIRACNGADDMVEVKSADDMAAPVDAKTAATVCSCAAAVCVETWYTKFSAYSAGIHPNS